MCKQTTTSRKSFLWEPSSKELNQCVTAGGDNFYVFHADRLEANCDRFSSAFERRYPRVRMAYSVKTNYLPQIVKTIDKSGWYSEVVSGFEYDLVRQLGIEGKDIIFNGPIKSDEELNRAISEGSLINVDSFDELTRIDKLSSSLGVVARVGIRVNFGGNLNSLSRFGLSAEGGAPRAIDFSLSSESIELHALHAHYCFPGKQPESYTRLVEEFIDFIDRCSPQLWKQLKIINFGGGFFSPMPEKMAANWGGSTPNFDEYADAITKPLNRRLSSEDATMPQLVLEPGLAVVADAMSFVCRVDNIKEDGGDATAILSGSVYNIKPTKSSINLPWRRYPSGAPESFICGSLTGYTCMEDDIMESSYSGKISPGDLFVFGNVGAYTTVLSPPFIRLAPAVLAIEEGSASILVEAESSDRFLKYRFNF